MASPRNDARTRARYYLAGAAGAAVAATAAFTLAAHAADPSGSSSGTRDDAPAPGSTSRQHRAPTDDRSSGVDTHRSRSHPSRSHPSSRPSEASPSPSPDSGGSGVTSGQGGSSDGSSHSS